MLSEIEQILKLIEPYVKQGLILPRDAHFFAQHFDEFELLKENNQIIACAGIKLYKKAQMAEIYNVAVHQHYHGKNKGSALFQALTERAKCNGMEQVFALSKYSTHWFLSRGFRLAKLDELPTSKQAVFDHQRNPDIFIKLLT